MPSFLIDEDLPGSLASVLRSRGIDATSVRELSLQGASDREVMEAARSRVSSLVTADLDFANIIAFPLGSHAGIIVFRHPSPLVTRGAVEHAATRLSGLGDINGCLVIIEPARTRIRRPD